MDTIDSFDFRASPDAVAVKIMECKKGPQVELVTGIAYSALEGTPKAIGRRKKSYI